MKALKNLTTRFVIALVTLVTGITVLPLSPSYTSLDLSAAAQNTKSRSEEILSAIMPNGVWGDASQLDRFERAEVIVALRAAQAEANGDRALGIVFLLAVLREHYRENRARLLEALKACPKNSYPEKEQCADFISGYLMELSRRGDVSLLRPLFETSSLADGGFSESLGGFYSDMLANRPEQFLEALRLYPRKRQRSFCRWAGQEDGSGMDEQRFRLVRQLLTHMFMRSRDPLAPLAKNCLLGVQDGHNEAKSVPASECLRQHDQMLPPERNQHGCHQQRGALCSCRPTGANLTD